MGKFYAVKKGRETGIFLTWDECFKQVNKFPGAIYKSFKTRAEAENFMCAGGKAGMHHASASSHVSSSGTMHSSYRATLGGHKASKPTASYFTFNGLGSYFPTYQEAIKEKSAVCKAEPGYPVSLPCREEAEALSKGEWEKYLSENITPFSFDDEVDAICFSDGSYDETMDSFEHDYEKYAASFGLVIILKSGKMISESGILRAKNNTVTVRIIYDEHGKEKIKDEIVTPENKVCYIRSGMAETAECEGGHRVLELCRELGLKKIRFIVDADNIPNAIKYYKAKQNADSLTISRLASYYAEEPIEISAESFKERIRSHKAYKMSDRLFLYSAMNDLCDVMAKAELPAKSGANIRKDNPNLLRIVSNPDGRFTANPEKSGLSDCIKDVPAKERRKLTREIAGRLFHS